MREILSALLLVAAVEGLLLAGFPEAMRRAMEETARVPARLLRIAGFGFTVIGIAGLWLLRKFGGF